MLIILKINFSTNAVDNELITPSGRLCLSCLISISYLHEVFTIPNEMTVEAY